MGRAIDTIRHPALLGHAGTFARQAARLAFASASPGLFDLPGPEDGPQGLTAREHEVLRAYGVVAQAFGLDGEALLQWHRLAAHGECPLPGSELLAQPRPLLDDLLLRVRTLAQYQDRAGRGALWMQGWWRVQRLQWLLQILDEAPTLAQVILLMHGHGFDVPRRTGDMRAQLTGHCGLGPAGWRWLLQCGLRRRPMRGVRVPRGGGYIAHVANLMAAMPAEAGRDEVFVTHVSNTYDLEGANTLAQKPWLLLGAWRQLTSLAEPDERDYFLLHDFSTIVRWVLETGWTADANQRRAGWPAFERAWRRQVEGEPGPFLRWPVPFESVQDLGIFAVPLGNSIELRAEGRAMRHCIGDYELNCADETFVAFSVRGEGGERIATFSFDREDKLDRWHYHSCKGRFNADVLDERIHALWWLAMEMANL